MNRDFKFLRPGSKQVKDDNEIENAPVNTRYSLSTASQASTDSFSHRPPLNTILDPKEPVTARTKFDRTPTKPKTESTLVRTPDKHRKRINWAHKDDLLDDVQITRAGLPSITPKSYRTTRRAYSESNSTQSTPTKSVSKPPASAFKSNARVGNVSALYRGVPVSGGWSNSTVVNTAEVPHFELKEDPSFWVDHNVQVLIRVRPLNSMEKNLHGHQRCLKQESPQCITWIGQPETRFSFDHVACETVDQEMLFRLAGLPMVENCLAGYNSCIFAYGQTGSGKTYTMLGEIDDLEVNPSPQRGMTPRIFEFLFARIQAEEEIRKDERLKYNCKCSFLEIYNEQITDLLDSSSNNLHLREDAKKGVYVQNLSEFEVNSVNDILKLLSQGSLNRKVAATNMNRESSRSHCVFTCVIESKWEKDSTTNLRFARLNLVDLAGSERQKHSGAEGERLKEAASINKSLSTLGHVIMILVDVAQGKSRHIPYRDSRLTFLLQDSLGGNSKTMIIANVSPSICCTAETLNTLKFAQRAKFIQNNAVVNEDSSGDILALQHQVRLLEEELAVLKRQNISRSLSFGRSVHEEEMQLDNCPERVHETDGWKVDDVLANDFKDIVRIPTKQLKSLETILAGALRREKMAETSIKKLEAEIGQLNRLVRQKEEDNRSTKMMLRFREDKIQRMESLFGGNLAPDNYLLDENKALCKEIQLLQSKVDKNPEVTRFALENIRLLEQLRRFQDFYEEGEREILLDELSALRDQLFCSLEADILQCNKVNASCQSQDSTKTSTLESSTLKETQSDVEGMRCPSDLKQAEEVLDLQLELDIMKVILKEERLTRSEIGERATSLSRDLDLVRAELMSVCRQNDDTANKLKEAKSVIEALESEQIIAINEMEDLRNASDHYSKLLSEKEQEILTLKEQYYELRDKNCGHQDGESILQRKLKRMQESFERLNLCYKNDSASKLSKEGLDEVRVQAEAEAAEVIICMQEELSILQHQVQEFHMKEKENEEVMKLGKSELKELQDKIDILNIDNNCMKEELEKRDEELRKYNEEWDSLAREIEEVLGDGQEALTDANNQVCLISSSFAQNRNLISKQIGKLIENITEKELMIENLGKCLESANHKSNSVERMINSLRRAAVVINEAHQQECIEKEEEILLLKSNIDELEEKVKLAQNRAVKVLVFATVICLSFKRVSEKNLGDLQDRSYGGNQSSEAAEIRKEDLYPTTKEGQGVETKTKQVEENGISERRNVLEALEGGGVSIDSVLDLRIHDSKMASGACLNSPGMASEDACPEDMPISLLKKEIDSALQSFQEVQEEVAKLWKQTGETLMSSDGQNEERIGHFSTQSHAFEEVMSNFGKQLEQKIKVVHNRLQTCEQGLQESETCCHHEKEVLFLEASDAKIVAAQKEAEASSIFSKFEEAQLTMKEADMMINELMIDNKSMKLDIERLKEVEETLSNERDVLVNEVQSLHALNVQKDQQFEELEIEFRSSLTSVLSLVTEMQSSFLKLQTSFEENFTSLQSDIHCLKIHASDSSKLTRSWLEDVCSEIIMKDCAVSALHLCYMGILLETVAGMHAENSLLQEGLVESNSVVADLKEQNSKSSNELQTFRSLKCKLLSDIKNSFDQLSRKEEDTEELSSKLNTFEKKVFDLQFLEEVMVERANSIGTELANLVNELHSSNKNIVESLLDKEKMLKDKEVSDSQTKLLVDWHAKDLESFLLASHLKEIAVKKSAAERRLESYHSLLDYIKEETILSKIESESREVLLVEAAEVAGVLINQVQELEGKLNRLQNDLKIKDDTLEEMGVQITVLEKEHLQYGAVLENLKKDMFLLTVIGELKEQLLLDTEGKVDLLECKLEEAQRGMKDMCSRMLNCDEERRALERERKLFTDVADSNNRLKSDLDEVIEINMRLEIAVQALEAECRKMLKDLKSKEMALDISSGQLFATEQQNEKLQDIYSLESSFRKLQNELLTKSVEINRLSCLEEEIISLKDEACRVSTENRVITRDMEDKNAKIESLLNRIQVANMDICQLKETIMSLETLVSSLQTDLESKNAEMTKLQQSQSIIMADLCSKRQDLDTFVGEVHKLKEENILLRNQLQSCNDMREVITRSSISTEKCFNLAENVHSVGHRLFNDLERETSVTSERYFSELNGIIDSTSKFLQEFSYLERTAKELDSDKAALQAELLKKDDILKGLLFDLSLLQESASNHKDQKDKLRMMQASMEVLEDELAVKTGQLLEAAAYSQKLEAQLQEKVEAVSILESDLARECESLKACSSENHELRAQMEEVLTSRCYLEETLSVKEAEIQLLEKSVEELEHAVDVLENKVDVLNEEAERQRLRREELEAEVSAISLQMQSVRNADTDMKRRLDEKEKSLEEVLEHAKILERDVLDKDAEISNFKAHVAELNLHAEAQATEYKQKFKALEAMVEQVKTEGQLYHTANSSSGKEKLVANTKPRGSGSPFKCIGLGLAQQIKSERDEELSAARLRIEELECLAASRQKEIFHLHKRLATAESMTHDVIRDLLGVKLDMTNFASLMDIKQVKKIAETAEIDNSEPKAKDMEAVRRKQKLNELTEDRSRLLEEIDQKNAELLAAQIEVEELHQRNQLVKTENEMFKMENLSHKQKVMELEEEVKALSGQQNMQQRIHHHAKIKEENLLLKAENEKLRDRQQRLKEVSQFRRSVGRRHSINFNEERLLMNKLKTSSHLSGTNLFLS